MSQQEKSTITEPALLSDAFELFKKAPVGHAMQNDLDMTTVLASIVLWLEQVNKVVKDVGKFSKNPALQAFSPKIDAYINALNDILEHKNKLEESVAPGIKR